MMAATARGLHRLEAPQPRVFDDPFALVLQGPAWGDVRDELAEARRPGRRVCELYLTAAVPT